MMARVGTGVASTLVALATVALFVPLQPVMPSVGLDPSWAFAMNQALVQRLSFGDQLSFSFGPWASLYSQSYHPATDRMMLVGGLYLASSCWFACWTLIDRRTWPWMIVLAAVLLPLRNARDAAMFLPPLFAVLASLHLTGRWRAHQQRVTWANVAALAMLFAPVGVLPLIKGSSLVLSLGIAACASAWYVADRKPLLAATVVIAPIAAAIVFWVAAGQAPATLLVYLGGMLRLSSAYVDAMSLDGRVVEILLFLAGSVAVLLVAAVYTEVPGRARLYLTVVYGILLFVAFKAAFVRHDGHAKIAGTTLLFAALTLPLCARPLVAVPAIVLAFGAWAGIDSNYSDGWRQSLMVGMSTVPSSLSARLHGDANLPHQYSAALGAIATQQPLPSMAGSTDIYPFDQASLFASENRWSPRPVFQTYAAFTPDLAEANRQHLVGERAPFNVVFRVSPIDRRVPSGDDGPSWPALLRYYQPRAMGGDFLFLRRRPGAPPLETGTDPLASSVHILGERVPLPVSQRPLFARLEIRPTLFGEAVGFLFKRTHLMIRFELRDGTQREYRLVPGVAASGFLLSPLIETTPEFGLLYGRLPVLHGKDVTAFTVAPVGGEEQWAASYRLVLTQVPTSEVDEFSSLIALSKFDDHVPGYRSEDSPHCDGFIDVANGVTAGLESRSWGILQTAGWVLPSLEQGRLADSIYVVLIDNQHHRYFAKASFMNRPDVSAYFHKPGLERTGFSLSADVSAFDGRYSLRVAVTEGDRLEVCPQPEKIVNISSR